MTSTNEEQSPQGIFSLTRMIYAVCGAIILYKLLEFGGWSVLKRTQNIPWGLYRFDLWFHAINLFFVLAMLAVGLAYHPKSEPFSLAFSTTCLRRFQKHRIGTCRWGSGTCLGQSDILDGR
jgi:hypothetical protein